MGKLLRRLRFLTAAERVLRALRVLVLLRAVLPAVLTAVRFLKEKGR